ncbi:MAG: exopolysaccharide biosynthesis polyprenyl glycosylphosphotransferase [Lachnospiraceae bacterium]|nr:exopolysaccharide biosynthesis polyprenyl glycosylphosphotransferase [Lachnospiraceae bacterium]
MNGLKRFLYSFLTLFKLIIYIGGFAVFFYLMGIENFQVHNISRTSVVMVITYVMLTYFLSLIYGGYDIGIRKKSMIILSMELSMILTDAATYIMLLIMNTNDTTNRVFRVSSFGYFVLSVIIQTVIIVFFANLGDMLYSRAVPPEDALIIIADDKEGEKLKSDLSAYRDKFNVKDVAIYNDEKIKERIRAVRAVIFYDVPPAEKNELINYCYKHLRNVYQNPEISDIVTMTADQLMFGDMLFFSKKFNSMTFEQRVIKRLMDIVISLICLILTSPLFLVAAIMIKSGDGGSIFFKQKRATINGRVFEIYKFRTMKENVENKSVTQNDDRITGAGSFLRKYRIDELPQLINIIKGDMSLVGPRPEMIENVNEYEKEMPEFVYRLRMKAGLTGLAQVMGRYNTSSRDKLILDLMYIENFSIMADIRLLFKTVLVLFKAEDSTKGF